MKFAQINNNINEVSDYLDSSDLPNYLIFLFFAIVSTLIGRYTPKLVGWIIHRFFPQPGRKIYDNYVEPLQKEFKVTGTLILLLWSSEWLDPYPEINQLVEPGLELFVTISIAWLLSRLFRQFLRISGIKMLRKMGKEDELLLILETVVNAIIGFIAVMVFLQSQDIDLVGLLAGLGIGGIAIAFAARETLEQLIGAIVLYLDRPFLPGDYIRVTMNPRVPDLYGRVESIGLRSTKIRIPGKNTLAIIPNSMMTDREIENVTRGKKVMVLLYLNFPNNLNEQERAFVEQVAAESTNALLGIAPGSTNINLSANEGETGIAARVSFFILGSSENSLELRKRLLELAHENISKKLKERGIEFTLDEPTIYVNAPVTI
ncbi:MAG: mechanosensitive ion channel family protein [Oscillatoria sp. PMC 1051.18]|nr:mechanosensitive ion channel family protein [Oscillatoria sp. PMC 1050.18]MEC5031505.1 mechanosensitive ion channel family protein [Oscillatoria sp. PMC 1051.18]